MNPIIRSGESETTQDRITRLKDKALAKEAVLVSYKIIEAFKMDPTLENAIRITYALYPNDSLGPENRSGIFINGCALLRAHGGENWSCNKCCWQHEKLCDLLSLINPNISLIEKEEMLGRVLMAAIEMQVTLRVHPAFCWVFMGMP